MEEIRYRSAFDESGNLVDINEVSNEDRTHEYRCISCGKQLVPRLGDIRRHHFYHKEDTVCKGETYLHELAKLRLKEKFDKSDHFYISYNAEVGCNQKCHADCKVNEKITEDLKLDYDTATIEKSVNEYESRKKYRADVLLTNSKDESKPPILLEIWVTSECKQEKKESDLRIIEIHIKEENDINSLYENEIIEETDGKILFHSFSLKKNLSSEKYISDIFCHKQANLRLKKKIDETPHFYISYKTRIVCYKENCVLRSSACERSSEKETLLDLKDYTAKISDINGKECISLTNNNISSPIFLVLNHNHFFCQEDLVATSPLIEIRIKDEKEYNALLAQETIKESIHNIIFHSFNRDIKKNFSKTIFRYILFYDDVMIRSLSCNAIKLKSYSESIFDVYVSDFITDDQLLYLAYEKEGIKSCNICSFFDKIDKMCTIKQNIYEPQKVYLRQAIKCQSFVKVKENIEGYRFNVLKLDAEEIDSIKTELKVRIINKTNVDYELFKSKCDEKLKSELKDNNVILIHNQDPFCERYAKDHNLTQSPSIKRTIWDSDDDFNQRILAEVDAVIVFWNGEDSFVAKLIEEIKKKELEYYEVNLKIND